MPPKSKSRKSNTSSRQWRRPTPAMVAGCLLVLLLVIRNRWPAHPASAGFGEFRVEQQVNVARVIDGDTIEVADGRRIRLLGIDAPEVGFDGSEPQFWSHQSTDWLTDQIAGERVTLKIGQSEFDRYGRTLAWIYTSDGRLVNAESMRFGMSRLLPEFGLPASLETILRQAEAEARVARRGVWSKRL